MTAMNETKCPRCAAPHAVEACPYVKAIEYHEHFGGIRRVEFLTPADMSRLPAPAEAETDYPRKAPTR